MNPIANQLPRLPPAHTWTLFIPRIDLDNMAIHAHESAPYLPANPLMIVPRGLPLPERSPAPWR